MISRKGTVAPQTEGAAKPAHAPMYSSQCGGGGGGCPVLAAVCFLHSQRSCRRHTGKGPCERTPRCHQDTDLTTELWYSVGHGARHTETVFCRDAGNGMGIYACNMSLNFMPRELPDYAFATFYRNLVFLEKKLVMTNDELLFPSREVKGTEL